jgi:hypothetical protein
VANTIVPAGELVCTPFVLLLGGSVEAIMLGDSKRAIQVNIQIIKTFTRLRQLVATNKEILEKIEKMEKNYDAQFRVVFDALRKE